MKNNNRILLDSGWQFCLQNSSIKYISDKDTSIVPEKYYDASVPGTIHTDLLNNNLIEDPFYSDNEKKLGWIADCDWAYKKEFVLNLNDGEEYNLVFDGLDTISKIYLNDKLVSESNNMFLKYSIDVTDHLLNGNNILKIFFSSPQKFSENEELKYGKLPVALNSSRVYIRKAQYSFGWDWGPIFTTSGIWKDVYLEKKTKAKIEKFTFNTLSISDNIAKVEIKTFTRMEESEKISLLVKLELGDSVVEQKINDAKTEESIILNIPSPKLWYPNGEGEQILYNLSIQLVDEKTELLNEINKLVGIRTIEIVKDKDGQPQFAFKVNEKIIYCKGSNWIPADTFLPRITDEKYFDLLQKAKTANMNIVRVWGGGIYEDDIFYEYCDQLGLLVWQDFMFACASYPEHEGFIKNIENEVTQNIYRLQHHPSIAIWCGNNENEWIWYQEQKKSFTDMSGYKIYHSVIPEILKKIDSYSNYWQSSPFGMDEDPNSTKSGNTHQWNLWSRWIDYTEVKNDDSLFVTEFGFQGPANISTWKKALPKKNRRIQDEKFEFHNKQVEGPERIMKFLSSHLPVKTKWNDFLYLTQLNQGLALKTCIEHWRTNQRTNGSIIWQLNDCWPVTSWSLIDSESSPKMSYHFVRNVFSNVFVKFNNKNNCTVYNNSNKEFTGILKIVAISLPNGKVIDESDHKINLSANNNFEVNFSNSEINSKNKRILIGTLYDNDGNLLHRNYLLNKKWKHTQLPKSDIELSSTDKNGREIVKLKSNSFSLFVDLYHPKLLFNNRGFIMLPNEEIEVEADINSRDKINLSKIKIFSLNNYLEKY